MVTSSGPPSPVRLIRRSPPHSGQIVGIAISTPRYGHEGVDENGWRRGNTFRTPMATARDEMVIVPRATGRNESISTGLLGHGQFERMHRRRYFAAVGGSLGIVALPGCTGLLPPEEANEPQ